MQIYSKSTKNATSPLFTKINAIPQICTSGGDVYYASRNLLIHLCFSVLRRINIIQWYICQWAAQTQSRPHIMVQYITHLAQHRSPTCLKYMYVYTKYNKYFRGFFNSRLLNFVPNLQAVFACLLSSVYSRSAKSCMEWNWGSQTR